MSSPVFYYPIKNVFLDIVAGMSNSVYFCCNDLRSGKIQFNRDPDKLPLIFMIRPDSLATDDVTASNVYYKNATVNFIIFDKYKRVDNNSDYATESKENRIEKDVVQAVGQLAEDFKQSIIKSRHIFSKPLFSQSEQIPLGVSIRDNATGKTQRIFNGNYAGILLSVTCSTKKKYLACQEQPEQPDDANYWYNADTWINSEYWIN